MPGRDVDVNRYPDAARPPRWPFSEFVRCQAGNCAAIGRMGMGIKRLGSDRRSVVLCTAAATSPHQTKRFGGSSGTTMDCVFNWRQMEVPDTPCGHCTRVLQMKTGSGPPQLDRALSGPEPYRVFTELVLSESTSGVSECRVFLPFKTLHPSVEMRLRLATRWLRHRFRARIVRVLGRLKGQSPSGGLGVVSTHTRPESEPFAHRPAGRRPAALRDTSSSCPVAPANHFPFQAWQAGQNTLRFPADRSLSASGPARSPSGRSARTAWARRPSWGCEPGFPTEHLRHSQRRR